MPDKRKTEGKLLRELDALRRRVSELEQAQSAPRHSEKQFKDLFDNAIVGIYRTTPDGRIIMANSAFVRMLGFSSFEELAEKKVDDEGFAPGYPRPTFKDLIGKKGKVVGFESAFLRRDGTTIFVRENARVVLDLSGRALYYEGVVEDITERKRAEESLRESEEKVRAILNATTESILLADKEGTILAVNNIAAQRFGRSVEEIVGLNALDTASGLIPPDVIKSRVEQVNKVIRSGKPGRFEDQRGEMIFDTNYYPLFDEKGQVTRLAVFARDITERKKAEEACRLSEEKFAKAFNSSPAAIFITTLKEGRFIDLNEIAIRMFGYTREDVVGHTAKELNMWASYNDRDIVVRSIQRGIAVRDMEARFRRKSGEVFDCIISVDIINIGGTECLISTIVDITERKQVEEGFKQYQLMVESAQDPMLFKDLKSRYIVANKTALQALGLPHEQVIGKNDSEVLRDKDEARMAIEDNNVVFRTGKPSETVRQFTLADGRSHWFHIVKVPHFDDRGKVVGLVSVGRDVTKLKKTEDELREEKLRYQTLFGSAPVGIGVSTPEGQVLECNDAMLKILGYSETEVKQINLKDIYQDPQQREELLKRLERDGFVRGFEVQLKRKDGTLYYASLTIAPFTLDGQNVRLTVQEDITERKRTQQMLNSYREKMIRAEQLASLGALGATLVHELAQPLTVITLSIENALTKLKTMSCPRTVTKKLKDSLTEVSDITSIAERFRNYARKSSEGIAEEVNLEPIAERTVRLLSESARQAKVTLRLKGLDKLPPVYSSEKDMEQLFFALVENAIEAANGKKDRHVVISGTVDGDYVQLRFADNCGGIAAENLDKIFEPFFTTKPAGERTGLGLCIVEHVVSRAGGKVRVESKAGKGSTFFVTLPTNTGKKS